MLVLRKVLSQKIPSGKLTWQWKMNLFEDVFPIENGDFPSIAMFDYRSVSLSSLSSCFLILTSLGSFGPSW